MKSVLLCCQPRVSVVSCCSGAPGLLRGRPLGRSEQLLFSHSLALNWTDGTRHSSGSPTGSLGVTWGCFHPQAIMAAT